MRIDTQLTDKQRDAVKEYAVNHGYTMKRAYTNLILDGLYDRFLMRMHPEKGNVGVKFAGRNSSILTNIGEDYLIDQLKQHDGDWVRIYAPNLYALERVGIETPDDPVLWNTSDGDDDPILMEKEESHP